jgi:hypothetical protein
MIWGGYGHDRICSWIYNCLSPRTFWVRITLRRGIVDTTLCDKVCQWLAAGRWFSPGTRFADDSSSFNQSICCVDIAPLKRTNRLLTPIKPSGAFLSSLGFTRRNSLACLYSGVSMVVPRVEISYVFRAHIFIPGWQKQNVIVIGKCLNRQSTN